MNEPYDPNCPISTIVLDGDDSTATPIRRLVPVKLLVSVALMVGIASSALLMIATSRTGHHLVSFVPGATPRGAHPTATTRAALPPPPSTEAPLLVGGSTPVPRVVDHDPRVAFFGDSLGVEVTPHLEKMLVEGGARYRFDGFGGTATCDYLPEMHRTASRFDPDVVVLLFSGNALTPCITSRSGGGRGILGSDAGEPDHFAFADAYAADTVTAIETFGPDTDIVIVAVPLTRSGPAPAAQLLDEVYRAIAAERPNVHYLSLDRHLTPGHRYFDDLPCLLMEPCNPGEPVPVRHPDGGHLCPEAPAFCFGGLRTAVMIGDAVRQLAVGPGNVHGDAIESATQADHQG